MNLLQETKLSASAKQSRFRQKWIISILIALLLFAIASALQSVVLTPVMSVWMVRNLDFGVVSGGSITEIYDSVMRIMNAIPAWFSALTLFLTVTVIIVCIIYITKIEKRSVQSIGFCGTNPAGEYLIGYGIGIGMLALSWGLCIVTGTATLTGVSPSLSWLVLLFFLGYLVQGMSEEVLCRGYLMQTLSVRYSPIVAVLLNSAFFALLHGANPGLTPLALLNLLLFGVFASLYMWKRGNIWGVAALHSAWNFAQGNLFGVRVSGTALAPSVLATEFSESGTWFNGGSFGLEGGVAVTIVYAVGIVILLLFPVRKEAQLSEITPQ